MRRNEVEGVVIFIVGLITGMFAYAIVQGHVADPIPSITSSTTEGVEK